MIKDEKLAREVRIKKRRIYERNKQIIVARTRAKRLSDPSYYLWSKARTRAKNRGIPFDIEPNDVVIPERCPVLGTELIPLSGTQENSPTLDRIKGELGYVRGNVVVISHKANTMKSNATLEEIRMLYRWMRSLES